MLYLYCRLRWLVCWLVVPVHCWWLVCWLVVPVVCWWLMYWLVVHTCKPLTVVVLISRTCKPLTVGVLMVGMSGISNLSCLVLPAWDRFAKVHNVSFFFLSFKLIPLFFLPFSELIAPSTSINNNVLKLYLMNLKFLALQDPSYSITLALALFFLAQSLELYNTRCKSHHPFLSRSFSM